MGEGIAIAIITGVLTLAGTIITVIAGNRKTNENMRVNQAVMDTKLDNLTEEVRRHNNFGQRIPVIEEQVRNLNNRVQTLEARQ